MVVRKGRIRPDTAVTANAPVGSLSWNKKGCYLMTGTEMRRDSNGWASKACRRAPDSGTREWQTPFLVAL